MVKLVKLPKKSKVIGHKIFKKIKDILRIKDIKLKVCGTI